MTNKEQTKNNMRMDNFLLNWADEVNKNEASLRKMYMYRPLKNLPKHKVFKKKNIDDGEVTIGHVAALSSRELQEIFGDKSKRIFLLNDFLMLKYDLHILMDSYEVFDMINGKWSLDRYQNEAMATMMQSCDNISYMFINLVGEVGEFASKVAKSIRKGEMMINGNCLDVKYGTEQHFDLMLEAGDILWQLAGLCHVMGWQLSDVANVNIEKLRSRMERNKIDGDGDHR